MRLDYRSFVASSFLLALPLLAYAQTNEQLADLNDAIDPASDWELFRAHDINDKGCITGWGEFLVNNRPEDHVFLLCEDCVADCSGDPDCNVSTVDLLALLAQWGGPGSCDIDGSGTVGTTDLLLLLGAWGSCCSTSGGSAPQSVSDCLSRFCCEPEDMLALEKCLCAVDPQGCDP